MKASMLTLLLLGFCCSGVDAEEPEPRDLAAADQDVTFNLGARAILEKRYAEAVKWLEKGSNAGDPRAQASLGYLYFNGWGVPEDPGKARKLYEESAAKGCHQGLNNLAWLYQHGLAGLPQDMPKAIDLLEQAAKLGNSKAVYELSRICLRSDPPYANQEKGISWLKAGAEKGDPDCLSDLAFVYQHGMMGVPADLKKAMSLYVAAIDSGSSEAPSNLGVIYAEGPLSLRDPDKARALYHLTIDRGNANGMVNLAVLDHDLATTPAEKDAAVKLMQSAKEKGAQSAEMILKKWEAR
jgi:TPR repeat protein